MTENARRLAHALRAAAANPHAFDLEVLLADAADELELLTRPPYGGLAGRVGGDLILFGTIGSVEIGPVEIDQAKLDALMGDEDA